MSNDRLPERAQRQLEAIERNIARVLDERAGSLSNLRSLAREGARLEGERTVLQQVAQTMEHYAEEEKEITPEQVLWAVLYGAGAPPYSSNVDAEAFAEGQRTALSWVRLNVRATEKEYQS